MLGLTEILWTLVVMGYASNDRKDGFRGYRSR